MTQFRKIMLVLTGFQLLGIALLVTAQVLAADPDLNLAEIVLRAATDLLLGVVAAWLLVVGLSESRAATIAKTAMPAATAQANSERDGNSTES